MKDVERYFTLDDSGAISYHYLPSWLDSPRARTIDNSDAEPRSYR